MKEAAGKVLFRPAAENLYKTWGISGIHPTQNILSMLFVTEANLHESAETPGTPHVPLYQFGPVADTTTVVPCTVANTWAVSFNIFQVDFGPGNIVFI